jgi:hypothetical protein
MLAYGVDGEADPPTDPPEIPIWRGVFSVRDCPCWTEAELKLLVNEMNEKLSSGSYEADHNDDGELPESYVPAQWVHSVAVYNPGAGVAAHAIYLGVRRTQVNYVDVTETECHVIYTPAAVEGGTIVNANINYRQMRDCDKMLRDQDIISVIH